MWPIHFVCVSVHSYTLTSETIKRCVVVCVVSGCGWVVNGDFRGGWVMSGDFDVCGFLRWLRFIKVDEWWVVSGWGFWARVFWQGFFGPTGGTSRGGTQLVKPQSHSLVAPRKEGLADNLFWLPKLTTIVSNRRKSNADYDNLHHLAYEVPTWFRLVHRDSVSTV